jgi:hypothetical protein
MPGYVDGPKLASANLVDGLEVGAVNLTPKEQVGRGLAFRVRHGKRVLATGFFVSGEKLKGRVDGLVSHSTIARVEVKYVTMDSTLWWGGER